jgi:hypothetical protein
MHGKVVCTSYHLGPSAHILINFLLNSMVSSSMFLRSNLAARIVRSDLSDMFMHSGMM